MTLTSLRLLATAPSSLTVAITAPRSPLTVFAEGQRVRIAGIGEQPIITRAVIVSKERVVQTGRFDLVGIERSVQRLPATLLGEPASFRSVEQGDVGSAPVNLELFQKAGRIRRRAMRCPPKRQAVDELDRLESPGIENADVLAPCDSSVEALGAVPVMIPRRDEDADRVETLECQSEEGRRVRREPLVLVQVAAAQDSIRFGFYGQVHDIVQRVTQGLPPLCSRSASAPLSMRRHYRDGGPRNARVSCETARSSFNGHIIMLRWRRHIRRALIDHLKKKEYLVGARAMQATMFVAVRMAQDRRLTEDRDSRTGSRAYLEAGSFDLAGPGGL